MSLQFFSLLISVITVLQWLSEFKNLINDIAFSGTYRTDIDLVFGFLLNVKLQLAHIGSPGFNSLNACRSSSGTQTDRSRWANNTQYQQTYSHAISIIQSVSD